MTTLELKRLMLERLKAADLLQYLPEGEQQCLDFPHGFFLEVVVRDASKLGEVKSVIEAMQAEFGQQGVYVDFVVRALWEVKEVRYAGAARAESGGLKRAHHFRAKLQSGSGEAVVEVDVSPNVESQLKSRLGRADVETLKKVVRDFLTFQLSAGGTSYWDPILYPRLEMGEMAAVYVLDHSPMSVG